MLNWVGERIGSETFVVRYGHCVLRIGRYGELADERGGGGRES